MSGVTCLPKVCEVGGSGLLLPLAGNSEQRWPRAVRAPIYLAFLVWCFVGVALVADVFMGAIERITSRRTRVFKELTQSWVTVKVWNDTVANLTLMALGSSAPEILLSVIELLGNNFYSGELGPSTIVGSAAFNLFCISAVCVSAIPTPQVRTIRDTHVFIVTAGFSVFAYLWLLLIVSVVTPDVIDIWEGVLTFLFFPALVVTAFLADRGRFRPAEMKKRFPSRFILAEATKEDIAAIEMKVLQEHGTSLPDDEIVAIIDRDFGPRVTRAAYRMGSMQKLARRQSSRLCSLNETEITTVVTTDDQSDVHRKRAIVEFASATYSIIENARELELVVRRWGDCSEGSVTAEFRTRDGTAHAGQDYSKTTGRIEFTEAGQTQTIKIGLVEDMVKEGEEFFYVDLLSAQGNGDGLRADLGELKTAKVKILDDGRPGTLAFKHEEIRVKEGRGDTVVAVKVDRLQGTRGHVSCRYRTEDGSATANLDYVPVSGTLQFDNCQGASNIDVTVKPRGRYESMSDFRVILEDPDGGATFPETTDGGKDSCICTVVVESDAVAMDRIDRVVKALQSNWEKSQIGNQNWRDQLIEAIQIDGSGECDRPTCADRAIFVCTVPWRLLFAICIPPVDYCGGWLCFCCALGMIGAVTAFIGDLATLLGCVLGIPDSVTAITLVALGTSMPDTFASKQAAEQDPHADASIGNVTGSNSVNVFLGLGLPWVMGAIYWAGRGKDDAWLAKYRTADSTVVADYPDGGKLVVLGGNLGFSVALFTCAAVTTIGLLTLRRLHPSIGGELGGPMRTKFATSAFLVWLWLLYIGLSTWKALESRGPCE